MTITTKKTLRHSLLLLMMAATGGYLFLAWSFPAASQAQAFRSTHIADEKLYDADWLESFYQGRNFRPLWLRGYTSFQPRADGVLKILEKPVRSVKTVALVDRLHRRYPIKCDFVGMTLTTTLGERVEVMPSNGSLEAFLV